MYQFKTPVTHSQRTGLITLRRVVTLIAILLALLLFGSLGFVWVEGWDFFDALYMTVTTLTTVGYGEIHPLDRTGRLYNMVLILAGMGVMLYIVTALARVVVEGEIQRGLGETQIGEEHPKTERSLYHLRLRPHRRDYRPATQGSGRPPGDRGK